MFLLGQYVYVKEIRAKVPREEDMGEVPCMDKACLGVLLGRTRDVTSKDAEVSVDAVDADGL